MSHRQLVSDIHNIEKVLNYVDLGYNFETEKDVIDNTHEKPRILINDYSKPEKIWFSKH